MTGPAQAAFDRGDYQTAARLADDPTLKGLALIMIGNPLDGLPLLSGVDPGDLETSDETIAILAYGHWLHGKPDTARAALKERLKAVPNESLAQNFLTRLNSGPIPCLVQSARAPLLASFKQVEGFSVTTIGSAGQDCDLDLAACDQTTLGDAVNDAAFLFGFDFAGPPPPRAADCSTPYLIHLTDPDVHVLTGLHPVRRYDRAIAGTDGQAACLRAITSVETVTAPFFGGLSAFHPSLAEFSTAERPDREIDLFFSGSYGTPIYHEKPVRFFSVSQIPDHYNIALHDSTRPLSDYAAALQASRFALVSVRAPGSFSTRAMQALECGAFVLCEEDSGVLDFFPGEDWGVFTYRPDHIAEDIAGHLARYDEYAAHLEPRRQAIRDRLAALSPGSPAAEERWLKFAAFQAMLVEQAGSRASRPRCIEPPLDWFTVRGFPDAAADDGAASRSAAYSALAIKARNTPQPPADWMNDDGGFTALERPAARLPDLQPELPGAFLRIAESWASPDRSAFEAAAEAAWQNRNIYMDNALDGLAIPDFWLGVFLNRLGMPLGRLYEEGVSARIDRRKSMEAGLLIAALGQVAAERAWADGETAEADERAREVAALDPSNHAAIAMNILCALKAGTQSDGDPVARLADYPWHLSRLLAVLHGQDDLDWRIADGKLHAVYLRFIQRIRDSRPLLSPAHVPAGAAAYLAWKLDLDGAASTETVFDRLRHEHLLLVDEDEAKPLIVDPILASLRA